MKRFYDDRKEIAALLVILIAYWVIGAQVVISYADWLDSQPRILTTQEMQDEYPIQDYWY